MLKLVSISNLSYKTDNFITNNPVNDELNIKFPKSDNCTYTIQVKTIENKLVYNSSVDSNKGEISISTTTFNSGIYLLIIQNYNTIWHKKLVIQH
jgi:hypothetical protein